MNVGDLVTPTAQLVLPADAPTAEWLEARRWREGVGYCLGASDFPSIGGVEEAEPLRRLYHLKRNGLADQTNPRMQVGHALEPFLIAMWSINNAGAVVDNIGLVSNAQGRRWLQTTLDARVERCPLNPTEVNDRCHLEVKVRANWPSGRKWTGYGVPDDVLAQVAIQMAVTGHKHVHIQALIGNTEPADRVVWWEDVKDIAAMLIEDGEKFRDQLEAGIEPPWNPDKVERELTLDAELHPTRTGSVRVGPKDQDLVLEYLDEMDAIYYAGKRQELAKMRMAGVASGHAEAVNDDGVYVWKYRPGMVRKIDVEKMRAEFPEAYRQCVSYRQNYTLEINNELKRGRRD